MGELFERDVDAKGGHRSADPEEFYERCLEMSMVRVARIRRALRSRRHELVFGYTSGLDLVGHISHDRPELQRGAYRELNEFVGELEDDLRQEDELLLVSDHGLQNGLHTETAMIAGTTTAVESVDSVLEVRRLVEGLLDDGNHAPTGRWQDSNAGGQPDAVREQLEDLGYM
jgi:hypothetical protein